VSYTTRCMDPAAPEMGLMTAVECISPVLISSRRLSRGVTCWMRLAARWRKKLKRCQRRVRAVEPLHATMWSAWRCTYYHSTRRLCALLALAGGSAASARPRHQRAPPVRERTLPARRTNVVRPADRSRAALLRTTLLISRRPAGSGVQRSSRLVGAAHTSLMLLSTHRSYRTVMRRQVPANLSSADRRELWAWVQRQARRRNATLSTRG
jgi:hypothetical protein